MKVFGLEISRAKALSPVPYNPGGGGGGWFNIIREGFSGAWQRNIIESKENILAFSAVFSCVDLIAGDISKLRLKLQREDTGGISSEVKSGAQILSVLRKPNSYQTRIQFIESWILSKLLHGNTYVLKERTSRAGRVSALYVLDPGRVTPLVTAAGDVYYRLLVDNLSRLEDQVTVPASEVIHDRGPTLWHPLCGVSPIHACAVSATQGIRIQANSEKFFRNFSRPSGQLTSPTHITEETAARMKDTFEREFSGENLGKLLVTGDGIKYEPMSIPAHDAQLIEQLKWTVEDVARSYHVPLHMIGAGAGPTYNNVESLTLSYYSQTLQRLIESVELLLNDGLGLPDDESVEFDLDALLRMDAVSRADVLEKGIRAGYLAPNEARARENLQPVEGGDSPMVQQQQFSLSALAKRDAKADPFTANNTANNKDQNVKWLFKTDRNGTIASRIS